MIWEAIAAIDLKRDLGCSKLALDQELVFGIPIELLIRPLFYFGTDAIGFDL
ncbi:hypothetical protein [Thermoleptolyngbya sp.]